MQRAPTSVDLSFVTPTLPATPISAMRLFLWQVLTVLRIRLILTKRVGVPMTSISSTFPKRKRQSLKVCPLLLRLLSMHLRRITITSPQAECSPKSFWGTLSRQRELSVLSSPRFPTPLSLIGITTFNFRYKKERMHRHSLFFLFSFYHKAFQSPFQQALCQSPPR